MADNTVPIIPPEIQELLSGPKSQTADAARREEENTPDEKEPRVYRNHDEILADDDLVSKLFEDQRVQDRINKAAEEASAKRAEEDKIRRDQEDRVRAAKTDAEQLEGLRRTSPTAYAEEMGRRGVSERAIKEQVEFATALTSVVKGKLTDYVRKNFPKDVIDSLSGRQYPGSYGDGVTAYFDDLTKATKDHWRAQWEKDEMPSIRKRVLSELNGGTETIESSTPGMKPSKDYATEEEMATAFQNDRISHEEMRAWYRTHGVRRR